MTPADVQLALYLVNLIRESAAQLAKLKSDHPEVYTQISAHVDGALVDAKAALDK